MISSTNRWKVIITYSLKTGYVEGGNLVPTKTEIEDRASDDPKYKL